MAESKGVSTDVEKESLNHENESTMAINPSDLNKPRDVVIISPCNDEESIRLDLVNENSESRKSKEMPEENTSPDIESCIQTTDESNQIPIIPDSDPTDSNVAVPISTEGNFDTFNVNSTNTNYKRLLDEKFLSFYLIFTLPIFRIQCE